MEKKQELQKQAAPEEIREQMAVKVEISDPKEALDKGLSDLKRFGGFDIFDGLIDNIESLNPEKTAAKRIFLTDNEFKEDREKLARSLELWIEMLSENDKVGELVDVCQTQGEKVDQVLKSNLRKVTEMATKLETSYRAVGMFFKNAESDNIETFTILNADKEELQDSDSKFFKAVERELVTFYDRLTLKNNYSLLVIPGWLGSKQAINIWAKIAHNNRVMLVTDYKDRVDFDMLKMSLQKDSLAGADTFLSNAIVACNYLVGRPKNDEIGEEDHLFVPPSSAIAGKMYNTEEIVISQGAAGKKYGTLNEVSGVRMDLLKAELASLIDFNVIPVVYEDNRVMAFSNKTLFNGQPIGLQEYPIVRVFDWISKVFMNFFNDVSFQNWNSTLKADLRQQVINFLDDYRGPGKLIEDYTFKDIKQNPDTKDISIEIDIKPFFAAKNFYIKLTGHDGKAGKEWAGEVS